LGLGWLKKKHGNNNKPQTPLIHWGGLVVGVLGLFWKLEGGFFWSFLGFFFGGGWFYPTGRLGGRRWNAPGKWKGKMRKKDAKKGIVPEATQRGGEKHNSAKTPKKRSQNPETPKKNVKKEGAPGSPLKPPHHFRKSGPLVVTKKSREKEGKPDRRRELHSRTGPSPERVSGFRRGTGTDRRSSGGKRYGTRF